MRRLAAALSVTDISGILRLDVPIIDTYSRHTLKMEAGYRYFADTDCKGVLKIDDDIKIQNGDCLDILLQEVIPTIDFFGIYKCIMPPGTRGFDLKRLKEREYVGKSWELNRYVTYFAGPFYWVSAVAIRQISAVGLEFPFEDVSVGAAIGAASPPLLLDCKLWYDLNWITWNNDTE